MRYDWVIELSESLAIVHFSDGGVLFLVLCAESPINCNKLQLIANLLIAIIGF